MRFLRGGEREVGGKEKKNHRHRTVIPRSLHAILKKKCRDDSNNTMKAVLAVGRHYKPRSKSTDVFLPHTNYFYFLFIKKSNFP